MGAKFERAYVSEIVGVDIDPPAKRLGFRIDPIGASKDVLVKKNGDGFEVVDAKTKGGVRPSELNHGNIIIESSNGGVRCRYAEQTTVISVGALRKLRFPVAGGQKNEVNDAGRAVLAAIGLCATTFSAERRTSLRSRCHLWPVENSKMAIARQAGKEP
jgi:CRISPR-associated protein Csb1